MGRWVPQETTCRAPLLPFSPRRHHPRTGACEGPFTPSDRGTSWCRTKGQRAGVQLQSPLHDACLEAHSWSPSLAASPYLLGLPSSLSPLQERSRSYNADQARSRRPLCAPGPRPGQGTPRPGLRDAFSERSWTPGASTPRGGRRRESAQHPPRQAEWPQEQALGERGTRGESKDESRARAFRGERDFPAPRAPPPGAGLGSRARTRGGSARRGRASTRCGPSGGRAAADGSAAPGPHARSCRGGGAASRMRPPVIK